MKARADLDAAIDRFWEAVPPAWHRTRAYIRRAAAEQFQLTVEQFQVLRRIRRGHNSVSRLADAGGTSRSAVSKAVDALVRRGLIERFPDAQDRRHIELRLTGEGERLLTALFEQTRAWLAGRIERLNENETERLLDGMSLLARAFQDDPDVS